MDISLAEINEDLQSIYKSHALYHLSQQNPSAAAAEADVALNPDPDTETGPPLSETAVVDHTNVELSIQNTYSLADAEDTDKLIQHDTQAKGFEFFGDESSSFTLSNVVSEASNLHFVDSATIKDDLNLVGLTENHLSKLASRTALSTNAQDNEIQSQSVNDQEIHSNSIYPVELTKSLNDCDTLSKVPDATKVKVVDLMDLSSIGELKRLWGKSGKGDKKSCKAKTVGKGESKTNSVKLVSRKVTNETEKEDSVKQMAKAITKRKYTTKKMANNPLSSITKKKYTTKKMANKTVGGMVNLEKDLKPCLIKVKKVEHLDFSSSDLKVDLTVPKSPKKITYKDKQMTTLSKKTVKKVTNYVAKSVGLKSKTAKKEITMFTMKAIKKVAKTIGKQQNEDARKIAKDTEKRDVSQTIDTTSFIKEEITENHEYRENETLATNDVHDKKGVTIEDDLEFLCESSDDYVPSEDEYKPSKIKSLKDVFAKSKKRKKKQLKTECLLKKSKLETVTNEVSDTSVPLKRPYVRRAFKTKRIGRPPVLGTFECKHCPFTANEKNLVDKHSRIHMRPLLSCRYCDATFRAENTLWEHEARNHTSEKPFKCEVEGCDYGSKCKTDLDRHQSKHATEKSYICQICGWRTKWRRNLRSHHLMKHTEERKFQCPECSFMCKRNSDLKQHMYRHTKDKPIKCLECGFQVKTNWELQSHMLSHSKEKPFKCTFPGCKQGTKTRADLNKHMKVHATERKYMCEMCPKGFKCRQSLNKHYSTHRETRDFGCDVCGKKFKNKPSVRKHMQLHSGIKPYTCDICGMKFAVSNNLKTHIVTHDTTNRPFLCPLCPHAAKQQDHLLAHIGTFHGKSYTYFCEFCKKPFGRYGQLKTHYKRMHGNKNLNSLGQLDLTVLKMEMKVELEEASEKIKRKSRKTHKKNERKEIEDAEIKEEPQDKSFEVNTKEASGITKVKSEHSVEIGVTKSNLENSGDGCTDVSENKPSKTSDSDMTVDNVCRETSKISEKICEQLKQIDENTETLKDEISIPCAYENTKDDEKTTDDDEKDCSIVEQADVASSSKTARLAVYDGFRLPLATRGFQFNYDKSGKKPKAWFMDVDLMNEKDSEKQKKYLRRIGTLPPLPRGHRKKNTLMAFVNRRRRKLNERIKKSNLMKETKNILKINAKRSARYQGNYGEFETLAGEELTVIEVREKLEQDIKNQDNVKVESSLGNDKLQIDSGVSDKLQINNGDSGNRKSKSLLSKSGKTGSVKRKQNVSVKSQTKAKPKSTVAAKKTIKIKKSQQQTDGRQEVQKKNKDVVKGRVESKKAKANDKSKNKSIKNASKKVNSKVEPSKTKSNKNLATSNSSVSKETGHKRKADSGEKPKYNKMYVPVKKRKTIKENNKSVKKDAKPNKTQMKNEKKKPTKSTSVKKKTKLKVRFPYASPVRPKVGKQLVTTDFQDYVTYPQVCVSSLDNLLVHQDASIVPSEYHDLPAEMKINQSEAALMNEGGVRIDKIIVLKTDVECTENGNVNEIAGFVVNGQALADNDSGVSDETGGEIMQDKTVPDVSMKTEEEEFDDSTLNANSYVIMDAETGKIKESVHVRMDTPDRGNELNDSGIQVKLEPDDYLD